MRWLLLGALSACSTAPAADAGLRLMSFNMANGAGDRFRTAEHRALQAGVVAGHELVALQEVDVGVERSGSLNTAVAISGLAECVPSELSADGVITCRAEAGVVLFGVAFHGDDLFSVRDGGLPLGILDRDPSLTPESADRRPSALYGNALIVRGAKVSTAVVVALPITEAPPDLDAYAQLANGTLEQLAAHNLQVRSSEGIEPRSVLVARVDRPGRAPLAALVLHLEAGNQGPLRQAQLSAALAIARGEQARGRVVVFLGDFNMPPSEAEPAFLDAGYVRAVGETFDQIWVERSLSATEAVELPTDGGSDHPWTPSVIVR